MYSGTRGDPGKESCTLSTAVNGANNGPGVSLSQSAWQVGRGSSETPMSAALLVGAGERFGDWCPRSLILSLGKAVRGSRGEQMCPSTWPTHGQGQGQRLEAASAGSEPQLSPERAGCYGPFPCLSGPQGSPLHMATIIPSSRPQSTSRENPEIQDTKRVFGHLWQRL